MSISLWAGYLAVTLFFGSLHWAGRQQYCCIHHVNAAGLPDTQPHEEEDFAHVFLYYPLERTTSRYSVYLNRQSIGTIRNGGRLECRLLLEGPVAVTIVEGSQYREPLTQSRNSRTVSVKKGKSYYFHINGNGELEYMFSTVKGEKCFAETKDFTQQPVAYTEPADGAIPPLGDVHN